MELACRSVRTLAVVPLLVGLVALGCTPSAPVAVVHLGREPAAPALLAGDELKLRRPAADTYRGVRGGAYAVRSEDDWRKLWPKEEPPPLPSAFDATKEMLLLVATGDALVSQLRIEGATERANEIAVRVRQTMLGEGCMRRGEDPLGVDAVVVPRRDGPVRFYVEDEDAPSCGEPPRATVSCRVGTAPTWATRVTAKAGDTIECELASSAPGRYELVDQMLSLVEAPPASNAKLTYPRGPTRASLVLDAFGTYAVRAEATDEAGRRGHATATIEVLPKKTKDVLLQLVWQDVDPAELATPLPRVDLRVTQEGPQGQRCSSEIPVPGLCEAKTRGAYTYMRIPAGRRRKLPLSLLYLDERAQSGPSPCVHVWYDGLRTATACDADHRHPEDRWELGVVDTGTGKLLTREEAAAPPPRSGARPKAP